ncbi:hypothetical protein CLF_105896 [Clonorchis sinensis]|uniref:Uncharacterized protein n=1 Tax=Clonorchis sinensis TaxID=79923 RepID=G7YPI8_CLOSI|nr:hypothetical protein CLF_105896 [Clonorchis sinensis]
MEIRDYVRKNHGIELTGDDVRVLRDKLPRLDGPVCDLLGIRAALRTFGPMAVSVCDDRSLNFLPFACELRGMVVQIDSKYQSCRELIEFEIYSTSARSRNQDYWSYPSEHWLSDLSIWANHARKHTVTLGNETTNRVESAKRHIK